MCDGTKSHITKYFRQSFNILVQFLHPITYTNASPVCHYLYMTGDIDILTTQSGSPVDQTQIGRHLREERPTDSQPWKNSSPSSIIKGKTVQPPIETTTKNNSRAYHENSPIHWIISGVSLARWIISGVHWMIHCQIHLISWYISRPYRLLAPFIIYILIESSFGPFTDKFFWTCCMILPHIVTLMCAIVKHKT